MSGGPPDDRPEPTGGFELEDAKPAAPRALPGAGEGAPGPVPAEVSRRTAAPRPPVPPRDAPPRGPDGDLPEVDARTFAEKHGTAIPRVAGVRDYPPGWPAEVARFPVRGHGAGLLAGTTGALFALDLLGFPESLRFLSWLVKTPALLFVVRWQLDLIGRSAAGHDEPTGWAKALEVDREGVKGFGRFLLWCFVFLLPHNVLWLLGASGLRWIEGTGAWEVGLLIVGSGWMAVYSLAWALEDSRLKRPWVTLAWLWARPLSCLAGSLGWWALGVAELSIASLARSGTWAALPAAVILRGVSVYALMLSARVLGCLGRRVDPERLGPA